jgi:hypothetical protein
LINDIPSVSATALLPFFTGARTIQVAWDLVQ